MPTRRLTVRKSCWNDVCWWHKIWVDTVDRIARGRRIPQNLLEIGVVEPAQLIIIAARDVPNAPVRLVDEDAISVHSNLLRPEGFHSWQEDFDLSNVAIHLQRGACRNVCNLLDSCLKISYKHRDAVHRHVLGEV